MAAIKLDLTKPGEQVKKVFLNLDKNEPFVAELYWESEHDLDTHALACVNDGNGAKLIGVEGLLSTFNENLPLQDGSSKTRRRGDKRPFMTPEGGLLHSGDARTGKLADVDEFITINTSKLPQGVNEIPILVTVYPDTAATFGQVKVAGMRIKRVGNNTPIAEYQLSQNFANFNAAQMGSFMLDDKGWHFAPVGVGISGSLNDMLENF